MEYNKTQLHPEKEFERHIFHRDQFAHYLRWTHVLNIAKIGMNILDFGCGNANLLEVFYRNKFRPKSYLGLDIRKPTIEALREKYKFLDFARFEVLDLCGEFNVTNNWDIISCFEVIEHIGKQNVDKFLQNIKNCMNENTILLLSTPCYDAQTGAANNHIINSEICELTYNELKDAFIRNGLKIENSFGTFASQKDYKPFMNEWQRNMFDSLTKYYDSNLVSNLMAPIMDSQYARNVLWRCKLQ